ncbi:MAG TPA: hypothetical protein VGA37_06300 [Gemmatimonadales bacterium]
MDDDEVITDLAREMLGRLGYAVSAETSSERALERIITAPDAFDLLIVGLAMRLRAGGAARSLTRIDRRPAAASRNQVRRYSCGAKLRRPTQRDQYVEGDMATRSKRAIKRRVKKAKRAVRKVAKRAGKATTRAKRAVAKRVTKATQTVAKGIRTVKRKVAGKAKRAKKAIARAKKR